MSLASDLRATWRTIFKVRRTRKFRKNFFETLEERGSLPDSTFNVALYFADTPRNMYQIRQWYGPFEALAEEGFKPVIITRSMNTTLKLLEETTIPVHYASTVADIEDFMGAQPLRAVFYPNQNAKNFHCLRNHGPAHVWINHGESDKASMTTNQVKAYDYIFVAGQAAIDRLRNIVFNYDVERLALPTGRPQIDSVHTIPEDVTLPQDNRKVIFYSPTWEGDRPSMNYSSILSHGQMLVEAVLANPNYRLLFRAHPSTGNVDPAYKAVLKDLHFLIEEANGKDPGAQHLIDRSSSFGWQLSVSDYCVADVSAVAFDWLPTGKPIYINPPSSPEAHMEPNGLVTKLPQLSTDQASEVIALFENYEFGTETLNDLSEHYFGETTPGASLERWISNVGFVVNERENQLTTKRVSI